jgi:hypothetical protein
VKPWVLATKKDQSPGRGGRSPAIETFLSPLPGLGRYAIETHGFTVGYGRSLLRSYKWQFTGLNFSAKTIQPLTKSPREELAKL